ncbi:hypothetical protein GCM10022237_29510 [Nocardioides ginsengisoli]|uniref:Peptidase S8/S53 domain-containing protein n=1 Tax=Nocardioides ginsengisoli TaxID=363868 RepID=A0ABW3VU43_9ACTN
MPEQHDPIEDLARFGAGFQAGGGGEMPRTAADVRRRGDQIRRRRTALVAGAAALAVAAITVPVLTLTHGSARSDRDDLITNDPTRALSQADLLTDGDTVYGQGNDWFATGTFEGDGQASFQLCAEQSMTGLGATATFGRTFELRGTLPDAPAGPAAGSFLQETVAAFPSPAAARKAYNQVVAWVQNCGPRAKGQGYPDYRTFDPRSADPAVPDGEATIIESQYGPLPDNLADGISKFIGETGLVLVGDRLAVIDSVVVGSDYNFLPEDGGTPVERMVPKAAARLLPGADLPGNPSPDTSNPPTPSSGGVGATAIPDDFPLAAGWPEIDGDGSTAGPARDLPAFTWSVCGADVPDSPAPVDRMIASWQEPEDGRGRQLSVYATEADAVAAAKAVVEAHRACPEEPADDSGQTPHHVVQDGTAGDESWVIGTWYTYQGSHVPALGVDYVIRSGHTVLILTAGNEGGAADPQGDIATTAGSLLDDAAEPVAQLPTL